MTRLATLLVLALPLLACAACGEELGTAAPVGPAQESGRTTTAPARPSHSDPGDPQPAVSDAVLFDDAWVVEEGVWTIEDPGVMSESVTPFAGQRNGLLGASEPGSLVISGPALYGRYLVRVELHPHRPKLPRWCEDVVEASLHSRGQLQMWSFETMAEPWTVPTGDYRVRYCAAGLDAADRETAEDEFDGDDYRLYSSRHLLQLWPAKVAPDEVKRVGSKWAASRHEEVR